MFKKLKEKKELENKYGYNNNNNKRQSIDESNEEEEEDNTNSQLINDNRDGQLDDRQLDDGQLDVGSDQLNTSNNNDRHITDIKLLNEQMNLLNNEIISVRNRNLTLQSQLDECRRDNLFLSSQLEAITQQNSQLNSQLTLLQSIGGENDDLMLRNAQLQQQLEQIKLQLEDQRRERTELIAKFDSLKLNANNDSVNDQTVSYLNQTIVKLEESLNDKNKTIKLQQQRLNDIKKTFQRDLLNQSVRDESNVDESPKHTSISSVINNSSNSIPDGFNSRENIRENSREISREINFTYLRNVIFKYMVSTEYEAIHLVKAISVLLNFSKEEEKLIKETIEWKMSWFAPLVASKPSLPNRK